MSGEALTWVAWCPCTVIQARLCDGQIIEGPIWSLNLTGADKPTTVVALRLPVIPASAIEAQRAETTQIGSVHESVAPQEDAQHGQD